MAHQLGDQDQVGAGTTVRRPGEVLPKVWRRTCAVVPSAATVLSVLAAGLVMRLASGIADWLFGVFARTGERPARP